MAILPGCPGLKAEVYVNGKPLREYDDDEQAEPKAVTKYVEAISGANFEVRVSLTKPFPDKYGVMVLVYLDGNPMQSSIRRQSKLFLPYIALSGAITTRNGVKYLSQFRFSELNIVQDSGASLDANTKQALSLVGCISVHLHYVTNIRPKLSQPSDSLISTTKLESVPEKALLEGAKSHFAQLETAVKIDDFKRLEADYVDNLERPFATFHFKYRSLASLKALHVLPHTPSPAPAQDRRTEDLSREALLERVKVLEAREAAREAERLAANVKQEQNVKRERDEDEIAVVPVKRERRERRLPQASDEVIVLD